VHRLSSVGEREARVLEISFGEFDEDDIVRIDDVYGRAGP
jgi:mannose-6-phosphate isomerase